MTKLVTFEDLAEGAVFWGEEVVADLGAMVDYAPQYDPWPFHVDVDAAKQTSFGGLVASARTWVEIIVVLTSWCPRSSWAMRMSWPSASRCMPNEWRSV